MTNSLLELVVHNNHVLFTKIKRDYYEAQVQVLAANVIGSVVIVWIY